jgi:dephospho-CoA kinase
MNGTSPSAPCLVLGLVGGIGAGKSRVSAALAQRGGRLVAGDPLGHDALRQPNVIALVVERWGREVLDDARQIDRRKLGRIVFADEEDRKELEAIVHPWIGQQLHEQLHAAKADPSVPFAVLDAAIMLEAGWQAACDLLVFVYAPRSERMRRAAALRGWSPEEYSARERAQFSLTEKARRADVALDNSGSLDALEPQVDRLLAQLKIAPAPTARS